jgi:4'-phosphopantetheinyl transferase
VISLARNEIHLWLAYYDGIDHGQMHHAYRALLDEEEKSRQQRFHFERDRWRYLVTRALVRTVLSHYEAVAPEDWIFSVNGYGRPEIANRGIGDTRLSFNISHTDGLIVLGVTKGRAVGVDVENVHTREVSVDIADRFFSPGEVAALARLPKNHQRDRFFEYWTFKESYIKARGMGLSIPLDKFAFRFPDDRSIDIEIDSELEDVPERWQFLQLRPTPEHLVAVCTERTDAGFPVVMVRETVPTGSEKILAPVLLRTSRQA